AVEELSCRADERPAAEILLVAGLLADHHHPGSGSSFAEDGLRACAPQVARLTSHSGISKAGERRALGYERCGRSRLRRRPHGRAIPRWTRRKRIQGLYKRPRPARWSPKERHTVSRRAGRCNSNSASFSANPPNGADLGSPWATRPTLGRPGSGPRPRSRTS